MIGSLGLPEILFIMVLALLVFGPKRLPQVGRTLGKGLREFRRATTDLKRSVEMEIDVDERPKPRPVTPQQEGEVETPAAGGEAATAAPEEAPPAEMEPIAEPEGEVPATDRDAARET